MERNITGQTEEKFMKEWNNLLNEKFHLKANLSGVFIDSWSQQFWNLPDEDQQKAFKRETEKLWQFAFSNKEFIFRTIEDVLEENQKLKEQNEWLNDVITNNISNLNDQISELRQQDQQHRDQISELKQQDEQQDIEIQSNRDQISELFGVIDSLENQISHMEDAPLGKIILSGNFHILYL